MWSYSHSNIKRLPDIVLYLINIGTGPSPLLCLFPKIIKLASELTGITVGPIA